MVVGDKVERIALPSQPIDLGRDYRVHTASGLEQYVADYNDGVLRGLEAQLRSPLGVIPFVGAGMSAGFGFPQWGQFLNQIAKATTLRDEIASLIEAGDYEEAAERLEQHLHPDEFQRLIAETFEREPDPAKLDTGALSFLPFLTQGPVLTTNFDRVLEHAFRVAGRPFKEIIPGRYPDRTMAAIHRNQRALLKLHGEARDRTFRVFTNPEYEAAFDTGPVTLTSMAWLTFTNRPLLFLAAAWSRTAPSPSSRKSTTSWEACRTTPCSPPTTPSHAERSASGNTARWGSARSGLHPGTSMRSSGSLAT